MNKIIYVALMLNSATTMAQEVLKPDGGGAFIPQKIECVTPLEYQRIHHMLAVNKDSLALLGLLPRATLFQGGGDQPLSGSLIWPVKKKDGLPYNSVYGVSNFVDRNSAYPNQLQDWNCGTRTYDLGSGYNHAGIDIFSWPFPQQLQANDQVEIVAAIGGTIIGKDDGYADNSCAMSGAQWNAVYVQGVDGNTYWYGHMKKNSLTTKNIGETVSQGEKIGILGSSGNSTGPHLHFEMYDANNILLDPYHGPCNNSASMWQNQKPYYEPTINTLMTHSAAPIMPTCPQLETINAKNYFQTNDVISYGAYFHDQTAIPAVHQLIAPDQTVHDSWTQQLNPGQYYSASWWYWTKSITNDMADGEWNYKVTFDGKVQIHKFYVNIDSGTSVRKVENQRTPLEIYPIPGNNTFTISGLPNGKCDLNIVDLTGKSVFGAQLIAAEGLVTINPKLAPGYYIIQALCDSGIKYSGKLIVNK